MNMKFFVLLTLCLLLCPVLALAQGYIDINTGSLAQLEELDGIGPTKAQAIIDSRPYFSVDDLDRVKGIGPATLQKIKDQGLAYVENSNNQIPNPNQIQNPNDQKITSSTNAIVYPAGVFINEILPNPQGADEGNEWIELYNSNNSDVDLSGWQIQDTGGATTTYIIAKDIKISADGFLIFKRPDTKIMLNNDKDGLNLLTPDEKIIDSIVFISAPLGQSYNKTSAGWAWSATLTPGSINIIAVVKAKTLPNSKNSVKNNNIGAGLADISHGFDANQDDNKITNPWFLFFAVLAATIILASAILLIKLKFLQKIS